MNLNKYEKLAIILTGILFVSALAKGFFQAKKSSFNYNTVSISLPVVHEHAIPKNLREISKTLNAFQDLYNTDELVFTYGYEPLSADKNKSKKFHEELTKAIEEAQLNYKVVPYKNYVKVLDEFQEKNGKDVEACTRFMPGEEALEMIVKTTGECLRATCVIDMKNKKYYTISRDISFIVKQLKELQTVK